MIDDEPISFVDTNIIVYSFWNDDPAKSPIATNLLRRLMASKALCTSTQVLQESYVTLTRKGTRPMKSSDALDLLDTIAEFHVVTLEYPLIREAARLSAREPLSFWDALLLAAAARARCARIYTEDMQHGRTIHGVKIVNPFR